MAENKKSFVLYADMIHTVEKLPDNKAGKLLKHLLRYVNDLNPVADDILVEVAFEPLKQQLKRDLKSWEDELLRKSEGGVIGNLKRWHNDLYEKVVAKELSVHDACIIAKGRSASDTDTNPSDTIASIADNVSVNDTVTVINTSKKITVGNQEFSGSTSEWLMLNKEEAINILLMNQYPKLKREEVFKKVDDSTVSYHFKDNNHPYNYFKSICRDMSSPNTTFQPSAPTKKYKRL